MAAEGGGGTALEDTGASDERVAVASRVAQLAGALRIGARLGGGGMGGVDESSGEQVVGGRVWRV
jgi:hypothetical protein